MTKRCVIAFSGGLDTSFLVPFAKDRYGFNEIITCTVNTGGFSKEDQDRIDARAKELGATKHIFVEAQNEFYTSVIRFLIFGNVTRDGYPLSVGSERLVQATKVLEIAKQEGASCILHGSTGAGNDQYRFDVAIQVLGRGKIECKAPIREQNISRTQSSEYLKERGISVPTKSTHYSYNVGLWGVTIGGTETHSSTGVLPEPAWYNEVTQHNGTCALTLSFNRGEATEAMCVGGSCDGLSAHSPVEIIKALNRIGGSWGIGRHYHVGTSIPGKKGRVAYESPAADILYEAHRSLEKITLTQAQIAGKRFISDEYGRLIHEAKFLDPYRTDLEQFLLSTQSRVTGTVTVTLAPYRIESALAESPWNLLHVKGALYGETSEAYSPSDAQGACRLHGFEQMIYWSFDD